MKKPAKFTGKEARKLEKFFSRPGRPEDAFRYREVGGFLFAVACCPEMIMPSEWLEYIFKGEGEGFVSQDEGRRITGALLSLYNLIITQVKEGKPEFPPGVTASGKAMENLEAGSPLSEWSSGFISGHNWLSELWPENVPEELEKGLGSILLVLSFFASREIAEDFHGELGPKKESFEEMAANMLWILPEAMESYADMGMSIAGALEELDSMDNQSVRNVKVGRNEPCPCGSGKKYKKCCGGVDEGSPAGDGPVGSIYELRVTLKNIRPPIWRTFTVPNTIKLSTLHEVLQTVMDWTDSHLHMFRSGKQVYELLQDKGSLFPGREQFPSPMDEGKVRLYEVLKKPGDKFTYSYDFGDDWEHEIKLEKIKPFDPETVLIRCLKGKRSCPPEDIGGSWGYAYFLEAIGDEEHPEHEELLDRIGGDFDPEYFDLERINHYLQKFSRVAGR